MCPFDPGSFLITTNHDSVGNRNPGYWNHVAVIGRDEWIVEAQEEPDSVIAVKWIVFVRRYPLLIARSCPLRDQQKVADEAMRLIGTPYGRLASIFPAWKFGAAANCVTVARDCFRHLTGRDPRWRIPDDVASDNRLETVGGIARYEDWTWQSPQKWFEEMITVAPNSS